jgi:phage terminase large subunit-like protein
MGLRGAGAKKLNRAPSFTQPTWKRKRGRVARVISFLESLPITKGILVGTKMRLLPGQREFVQAIYGRLSSDGRRKTRIAIKSEPRGNGKTGLIAGLACVICSAPNASRVASATAPLTTSSRPL